MWRPIVLVCAVGLAIGVSRPASAKQVALDFEEVVQGATVGALGTVTSLTAHMTAQGDVVTEASILVETPLRGNPSGSIIVQIVNPAINGVEFPTRYNATFVLNERLVVFAEDVGGALEVVGGSQGKFTVDGDEVRRGHEDFGSLPEFLDRVNAVP